MSYLLFMDESGHDHKNAPYEVRGGIALHSAKLWPFVQAMKKHEQTCYGDLLHRYDTEIKGHKLLDKDRISNLVVRFAVGRGCPQGGASASLVRHYLR